jgi:hypothetical protein
MRIAVIGGNYNSQSYKELLEIVRLAMPEEIIIDMSRHQSGNWKTDFDLRCLDIDSAHRIIVPNDWRDHIDAKADITHAQKVRKDLYIYLDGKFYPWEAYCAHQ